MDNEMDAVKFNSLFNHQDLLSREEENHLVELASKGNIKARQKLVLCNLRYAASFAGKHKVPNLTFDDLYSECVFGLIEAANHVKPDFDNRFITYANWWMCNAVNEAVNNGGNDIRLPERKYRILKKVRAVYSLKMARFDDEKKCRKMTARELGISEDDVTEYLMMSENMVSLDGIFDNKDSHGNFEDVVSDRFGLGFEDNIIEADIRKDIRNIVKRLPKKEADVLIKHFGLNGNPPMSFSEIGKVYGFTKAWANDVEKKAKAHLLQYADELEQFIA